MSNKPQSVQLSYNGAVYELEPPTADELRARGVIVADPEQAGAYRLSPDHVFDEIEPLTKPVWRKPGFDPAPDRLRMLSTHRDGQRGR